MINVVSGNGNIFNLSVLTSELVVTYEESPGIKEAKGRCTWCRAGYSVLLD